MCGVANCFPASSYRWEISPLFLFGPLVKLCCRFKGPEGNFSGGFYISINLCLKSQNVGFFSKIQKQDIFNHHTVYEKTAKKTKDSFLEQKFKEPNSLLCSNFMSNLNL